MWHTGLVAPRHVGSSRTRARTRVPCIGRRSLNHCATREVQDIATIDIIVIMSFYTLGDKGIEKENTALTSDVSRYLMCVYIKGTGEE